MEEIRVNKKIGGRRTTIVPRMSIVPKAEEARQEETNEKNEISNSSCDLDLPKESPIEDPILANHCLYLAQKVQRNQVHQQREETKKILNEFVPAMVHVTERKSRIAKASVIADDHCRTHIENMKQRQKEFNIKTRKQKLLLFTEAHCSQIHHKQLQFLQAVTLLQSVWRRFLATKQQKTLQNELNEKLRKETAKLLAVQAVESIIPNFKNRIEESRKKYMWEQAAEVMKQITEKNKKKVKIAQDNHIKRLQAEEKLRAIKERQQKQQELADEIVPEVIKSIESNSPLDDDVNPLKSVDTRLAALRKSRLQWKARLEKATKFTNNMESIDQRFDIATADMQNEQSSSDVNKILQQQQNFLQSVKQKRMAIRQKLQQDPKSFAPSSLADKENLH